PDDAALAALDVLLGSLDPEILVNTRQLLDSAVEQHEILHQFDEALLAADLCQILVELVAFVLLLVLLPFEEVLLRRADGSVLKPLSIISGKYELNGGKEPFIELGTLVGKV